MSLTQEQLKLIGGSDMSTLLGVNPWNTPFQLWLRLTGQLPEQEEKPHMRRGKFLEKGLADWYSEETGYQVKEQPTMRVHDWLRASVDRIAYKENEQGLLEIKTAKEKGSVWGESGTDEIPLHYYTQVQTYLYAFQELQFAHIATLFMWSDDFSIYKVAPDKTFQENMIETAKAWWDKHIVACEPPPVDGSDGAKAWITERRRPIAELREPSETELDLMDQLNQVRKRIKVEEEQEKLLKNQLLEQLGDYDGLQGNGYKLTYKAQNSSRIDVDSLRKEQPEIAEKYTKTSTSHRFLFTVKGE